jgi:hypothetical protein
MVLGSHANPLLFRKPREGKSVTGLGTSQRRGADDGDAPSGSRAGVATPERGFRLWPPQVTFDPAPLAARARGVGASLTPAALWRNHRLFTIAACLSVIPRVIAALGFKPALFIQDSFSYMKQSVQLLPLSELRPAGYPLVLHLLQPFHSLLLVTTIQHLMGIALGCVIYAVLRTRGLPAWGATLAAVPTLFDSRQIWLESSILPDTLFTLVLMIAVAMRVGWKVFTTCLAAFVVPLAVYGLIFFSEHGQLNITDSTGLFLWSRTMSFANCAVIKPPPSLVPLCPENQPGHPAAPAPAWSVPALLGERTPADYLWAPGAWFRVNAHPGINARNNKLAMQFAERAIAAQPLAYLGTVGKEVLETFFTTDRSQDYLAMQFTVAPHVNPEVAYMRYWENRYAHARSNTHVVQPWAYFMFLYQEPVWFPGWVFFLVMAGGLVQLIRRWRGPGRLAALAWGVAVVNLVLPIAAHELDYRYAISAVPFACLALGLTFIRKPVPAASAASAASAAGAAGAAGVVSAD